MINLSTYIGEVSRVFPALMTFSSPWQIPPQAPFLIRQRLAALGEEYIIREEVAIHREAVIESGVILKGPIIISKGCFVAAHAYLRGGVFLSEGVTVGPGCEVKSSFVFSGSALAHFNFVGDSLLGSGVNMEAGSILANHFNERDDKTIHVRIENRLIRTEATKFGALIGDHSRLGANAVTQPGTLLPSGSIVGRLQLVDQTLG